MNFVAMSSVPRILPEPPPNPRKASLERVRNYSQQEIYLQTGDTRKQLLLSIHQEKDQPQERATMVMPVEATRVGLLHLMKTRRDQLLELLIQNLEKEDQRAVRMLGKNGVEDSLDPDVLLQTYIAVFTETIGRSPDPEERDALRDLVQQTCNKFYPIRLATDKQLESLQKPQKP